MVVAVQARELIDRTDKGAIVMYLSPCPKGPLGSLFREGIAVDGEGLGGGREGRVLCRSLWSRLRLFAVVDGCLPLF